MSDLTVEQQARRRARYFWDTRRTTDDPETEGYGWNDAQMFMDLEQVEAGLADLREQAVDAASYWAATCMACGRSRKEPSLACSFAHLDVASYHTGRQEAQKHLGASLPDDLRLQGWAVAIHNDYRQGGVQHTFWLFTKNGSALKGEGATDAEALDEVRAQLEVQHG